jgi:hypothetical protein
MGNIEGNLNEPSGAGSRELASLFHDKGHRRNLVQERNLTMGFLDTTHQETDILAREFLGALVCSVSPTTSEEHPRRECWIIDISVNWMLGLYRTTSPIFASP